VRQGGRPPNSAPALLLSPGISLAAEAELASPSAVATAAAAGAATMAPRDDRLLATLKAAEPRGPKGLAKADPGAALALAAHCCMLECGFQVRRAFLGHVRCGGVGRGRAAGAAAAAGEAALLETAERPRRQRRQPAAACGPRASPSELTLGLRGRRRTALPLPAAPLRGRCPRPAAPIQTSSGRRRRPRQKAGSCSFLTSGCLSTSTPQSWGASRCTARCSAYRDACSCRPWRRARPAITT
jgi:hypothetical protein